MKPAIPYLLPAMLMAFGGAHAQQAPVHPVSPPPAPVAASASQVANCGGVANKTITAMNKGDFDGARKAFDPRLQPTSDKLQQAWGSLTQKYGKARTIGAASKGQMVRGYTVVLVPMQFEKGRLGAEAACTAGGQLEMLRFGQMPDSAASKS